MTGVDMVRKNDAKTPRSQEPRRYGWWSRLISTFFTRRPCPREMLIEAADVVHSTAVHDELLKRLSKELLENRQDGKPGQTSLMNQVDFALSRILVDALRRFGLRYIRVQVASYVQPGRLHAVLCFFHRGRQERRYIEVKLK